MKMLCMRRWSFLKIMDDFVSSRFSFPNIATSNNFFFHERRLRRLLYPTQRNDFPVTWHESMAKIFSFLPTANGHLRSHNELEKTLMKRRRKNPFFRRKEIHRQLNKTEAEKGVWGEMALGGVKRAFLLHHNTSYFNGSEIYVSENVFLFISPHIRRRMEKKNQPPSYDSSRLINLENFLQGLIFYFFRSSPLSFMTTFASFSCPQNCPLFITLNSGMELKKFQFSSGGFCLFPPRARESDGDD